MEETTTLLYCIGAQKAGTTWLYSQLYRHGRVFFARKEFHYWDAIRSPFIELGSLPLHPLLRFLRKYGRGAATQRLAAISPRAHKAILAWQMLLSNPRDHGAYLQALQLGNIRKNPIIGDATPSYALLGRRTFSEMAALHPNSRFIFIMRDPVDRLWSGVRHRVRPWYSDEHSAASQLPLLAFEDAVSDPLNADARRSDYVRTILELEAAVPQERILYLFYETLFNTDSLAKIADFLGVDKFEASFSERTHAGLVYDKGPSPETFATARIMFSSTYDFVFERFGSQVPREWRKWTSSTWS